MKKVLVLLLASFLVLAACGNSSNKSSSIDENKPQFKNDVLVIDDAVLTIKDTFLVNDKLSDKKLLAFKYEVKNKTDKEEITPINVWVATMTATQDSKNTVNQLEVGTTPNTGKYEKWDKHSQDAIKKNKKAKGIITYELENNNTVDLKGTKGVDGKTLGTKKINIKDLKTVDYDAASDLESSSKAKSITKDSLASIDSEVSTNNDQSANSSSNSQDNSKSTISNEENKSPSVSQDTSNQQNITATDKSNNDYMTEEEIAEWNKTKPTTHDESQMEQVSPDQSGGHPSAFSDSDVPVGIEKQDSNGESYIDATGE
ncbi:DUF5067 domain-containing protein [Staphylococcus gallinarum]|uniref:DUF5067 domain-containing protein n=1 Tax=Staphylococcus gallinarum TaxID=1293 RepID=UPI002DBDE00F|nr:DUF5067 domain-containing protein [Staphylococcus gallinarum]MEB6241497.1 DUF5067 domain-containing protein [Staphylococcus gallinarum]MEB6294673.1 DUF5067 domain-containing protein [Staphylococcus gallinarum]